MHTAAVAGAGKTGKLALAGGAVATNTASQTVETATVPTVWTDKLDYAPGEWVTIKGAGWTAGNNVDLVVTITVGGSGIRWQTGVTPLTPPPAVGSDGTFTLASAFQMGTADIGRTFELTASSGSQTAQAPWVFTDSPKIGSVSLGSQNPNPVLAGNDATYTVTVTRGNGQAAFIANLVLTCITTFLY